MNNAFKTLKAVSILQLLLGIFTLIAGAMMIATLYQSKALVTIILFLIMTSGFFNLLCGIVGLRAVKNCTKSAAALVLSIISLAVSIATAVLQPNTTTIASCVVPVVYFLSVLNVRKYA